MSEPLDHIERTMVPWRNSIDTLTECGKRSADIESAIGIDELVDRWRRLGQKRAALTVCMVCFGKVQYAGRVRTESWHEDPCGVLLRELQRVLRGRGEQTRDDRDLLARELFALGMLAEDHREEFDAAVDAIDDTISLREFRSARAVGRAAIPTDQ